jgi:tetratricopeptide (TPR) repeat protein
LGWSLLNQKKYAAAAEVFQKGLNLNSEESNFFNGLGWSLHNQKKDKEAEKVFQRGLALDPSHAGIIRGIQLAALNNKNYEGAKRYNEEYLKLPSSPNSKSAIHSHLGVIGILLKDYDYAENHLREALALDSTQSQPYLQLGYLYAEQKRYTEATRLATKALKLDSSFANYNLAAMILVAGDIGLERGRSLAQKALALKPDDWRENLETYPYLAIPEHTLGLTHYKNGDYETALQYLEQAVAFAPERQDIRDDLQIAKQKVQEVVKK